jgi:hypothetical protein
VPVSYRELVHGKDGERDRENEIDRCRNLREREIYNDERTKR